MTWTLRGLRRGRHPRAPDRARARAGWGGRAIQLLVNASRRGLGHGLAAYLLWGTVPVFWKLLGGLSPVEILAHRVVWGALALVAITWLAGAGPAVRAALADRKTVALMAVSGTLLVINWGVFV